MIDTFKRIWKFSENRHKNLISSLICSFLRSALGLTQIIAIIKAVDVITGKAESKQCIILISVLTLICIAGNFIISYFEQINSIKAGMYLTADIRNNIARKLRLFPLGYFTKNSAENIISTLTTTLSGVEMAASMTIVVIISGLFNAFAMFVFMLLYEARLGLIMGAGIIVYLLIVNLQMKVSRKDAPARQAAQTGLSSAVLTFLDGIKVIKSNSFAKGDENLHKAIDKSSDKNIMLTDKSMPSQFAAHLTIAIFESFLLAAAILISVKTSDFTYTKTIVLIIFSFMAFASLNQAGSTLSMIGMVESGIDEVEDINKAGTMSESDKNYIPENNNIKIENLSFSYGENEVLHNITTSFDENSMTAIIGPSGSGKTTLCRLIARYHDIDKGKITIGGKDIKDIDYKELMQKISIVFQNVYLFEDTILNNIKFGKPDSSFDEVRKAAKAARCDDFIMSLPDGYNTVLTEGGSSLSGGEKQRISIARAILKDSPVIILDEATSALDAENESAFFRAVDELIKNKTVIMIAHRLSTVKRADKIIAVKDGRIVQEGTKEELENIPGIYSDFIKARNEAVQWHVRQN